MGYLRIFFNNNNSIPKKIAFTLSEVLITLGIIGVVAALTMPVIIKNYKAKVLETQFKKVYSDLNTASKNFQMHNEMSVSEYATNATNREMVLKQFLLEYVGDKKLEARNNFEWQNFLRTNHASICDSSITKLPNGILIHVDDLPNTNVNGPKLCVDVNGEKGPNIVGIDYFVFMFTVDGYVIPYGKTHPNNPPTGLIWNNYIPSDIKIYCLKNPHNAIESATCSNFALINQHPTDPDKDYWHDFINGK